MLVGGLAERAGLPGRHPQPLHAPNLRLLSSSSALVGRRPPSNTMRGMTPFWTNMATRDMQYLTNLHGGQGKGAIRAACRGAGA
jgi:hypothetical protein